MNQKQLYSIRGAITCENTKESIQEATEQMCRALFEKNTLSSADDILNIQFTLTKDLTALNPATALRNASLSFGISPVPLFCSQEADIDGMLGHVIRIMVTAFLEEGTKPTPVYLKEACRLRPDLPC